LNGELDIATLQRALIMVAERQPTIRAQFLMDTENGYPYKQFNSSFKCDIACHVAVALPDEAALEALALDLVKTQTALPFDLESGPLVRALVIKGLFSLD
jgi:NRPS condensation-like uncharacterized protein